jgi:hypothetical protein
MNKREFRIIYDPSCEDWTVMERSPGCAPSPVARFPAFEEAVKEIARRTSGCVMLAVQNENY